MSISKMMHHVVSMHLTYLGAKCGQQVSDTIRILCLWSRFKFFEQVLYLG